MAPLGFEKDTWLDLTVNVIPLVILAFFLAAFLVVPAWGVDPVFSGMQFAIVGTMFVALTILTYYAGRAIEGAEASQVTSTAEASQAAEPATAGEPATAAETATTADTADGGRDASGE